MNPPLRADDFPRPGAARRANSASLIVVVAARNEAELIGATLKAVAEAAPGARLIVADDASTDETAQIARAAGAEVVSAPASRGKGGNVTAALEVLLADSPAAPAGDPSLEAPGGSEPVVLLCDGDLAGSARELAALVRAVEQGECDLAVAAFTRRIGGGLGLARGAGRRAIRRLCGLETEAPLSGQRAMRAGALRAVLPFAPGFGMEVGMTVDAVRAGLRVAEVEVDLAHRATGRTVGGFIHRGRQLRDIARAYVARRGNRRLRAP